MSNSKNPFWKDFLNQDIAIYVTMQERYNALMQYFYFKDLRWVNGDLAIDPYDIPCDGIFILGTLEKQKPYVLINDVPSNMKTYKGRIVSVEFVLYLFRDEIQAIEKQLGHTMKFIFEHIIGKPVYCYDPETEMMWDLKAEGIRYQNDQYVIYTKSDSYPLKDLNRTWFLTEEEAMKCFE